MPLLISLTLIVFFNIMVMVNLKMLPAALHQHHQTRLAVQGEDVIHSVAMTVRNAYNVRRQTDGHRAILLQEGLITNINELNDCTIRRRPPGAANPQDFPQGAPFTTPDGVDLCLPDDIPTIGDRYCFNYPPPFERLTYCFSFVTENNVFAAEGLNPYSYSFSIPLHFELWPKAQAQVLYFEGARPAAPAAMSFEVDGRPARLAIDLPATPPPGSPILACDDPEIDCLSVSICLLGETCPLGEGRLILSTFLFY